MTGWKRAKFDRNSFQRVLAHDQKLKVWPPPTAEEKSTLKPSADLLPANLPLMAVDAFSSDC